jgi:carboxylesterase type B
MPVRDGRSGKEVDYIMLRSRFARWRTIAIGPLVIAMAVSVMVGQPVSARRPLGDRLVVDTDKGAVRGHTADGVIKFLGIPYAAPPVGNLRWKPPAPAHHWKGIRNATKVGSRCSQLESSYGPRVDAEDCLYLNIYRPRNADESSDESEDLPVLFMIHGGAFAIGSGDQHDGALISRTDKIIVVSINYRLGVFGFLSLPSLSAEAPDRSSGNYGMLDWLAALRWTHRNIAAFGGDPENVTIAGESAGGIAVCATLASPLARELFSRAVIQSGSCDSRTLADSHAAGAGLAASLGCTIPARAAACMRSKTRGDAPRGRCRLRSERHGRRRRTAHRPISSDRSELISTVCPS